MKKELVKPSSIRFQSNSQIIIIGNCKENDNNSIFAINTYNNSQVYTLPIVSRLN